MAKGKKHPFDPEADPRWESLENMDLDDLLLDLEPAPEIEENLPESQDGDREALRAGDTMQFSLPEETPLPSPPPEKTEKAPKRRGKRAWGRKKADRRAKEEEKQQELASRDTVRLDRTLIATKAAELEAQTVRFSVPACQQEDLEEPAPSEMKETPLFREDDLLTDEDVERIAQEIRAAGAEQGQEQSPDLKLVEKPEKRKKAPVDLRSVDKKYEDAAVGLGAAQTRLFFAALLTGCSLILTVLAAFHALTFRGGISFLPFLQVVLLLLCALMTYDMIAEGLLRLFRLRPDLHTVMVTALVFSVIDGIQCILTGRPPFTGLVCLWLTMALWSNCQNRARICDTIDVVRRGGPVDAALREPSLWEGKDGILRGSGNLEEFLLAQDQTPRAQLVMNGYSLIAMAVSGAVGGMVCGGSLFLFARCFTGMLLAAMPALAFVTVSRPWALAAHRLKHHGAALCGWEGAKNTRGSIAVPLGDKDLFPEDKLRMNGIKLYPDVDPDKTIAYGAAAICASGSGLAGIFTELVERRNLRKCQVEKLRRYDAGGISAEIGQDSVLAGSLPFMQAMGVDMPQGTRVNQAVYVAVNGFLGGVFAVNYAVTRGAMGSLGTLVRSGGVSPVLTAQDFVITPEFLQNRFKVNPNRIVFPSPRARAALAARRPSEEAKQCALLTKPEFSSLAKAVACGRAMYTSVRWAAAVNLLAGVIGLGMTGVLAWIGAIDTVTAGNLLLYALVWSVPTWILGGLVRSA